MTTATTPPPRVMTGFTIVQFPETALFVTAIFNENGTFVLRQGSDQIHIRKENIDGFKAAVAQLRPIT